MNSLVIPVYRNEANLGRLLAELVKLNSSLAGDFEVVFVVDGSPDRCLPILREKLVAVLVLLAILTMIYGNLAAMPQDNFKRLLAYSSIAHAGYLLVAIASIGPSAGSFGASGTALAFYLAGYLLMTLLTFLVLIVVARHSRGDEILHFNGLARRSPFRSMGRTYRREPSPTKDTARAWMPGSPS